MRGEKNCFGIATKWSPKNDPQDFFSDREFEVCKNVIDEDFRKIPPFKTVVIPVDTDGNCTIGLGLSKLNQKAPSVYKYLKGKIDKLISERSR